MQFQWTVIVFGLTLAGCERDLSVKITWPLELSIKKAIRAARVVNERKKLNDRFMQSLLKRDTKEFKQG